MPDRMLANPSGPTPRPLGALPVRDGFGAPIPTPLTSLVGREREVAAIVELLQAPVVRLVTLTGPGGIGKTRLAMTAAAALTESFDDGIVFIDLAPIRDPSLVLPAIAQGLGVREGGDHALAAQLTSYLHARELLLVIDNCEQVLAAAPDIAGLLSSCPALKVLATSRAPLRVGVEHVQPVPPLALPDPDQLPELETMEQIEAVALFAQRARTVQPDFALTDANAAAVAAICRHLDGLPLAIELAAARTRLLSPQAMQALLSRRLRLLTSGPQDAPVRQRTLRDTIAWSYNLLTHEDQTLFRRLAVFAGGFNLEALEAITGCDPVEVLEHLEPLVDQSLLRREERPDGDIRYGMLDTVREFALEELHQRGEENAARRAHAAYFLELAEQAEAEIYGSAMRQWHDRLDVEYPNLRAALASFAETGDAVDELRLAAMLAEYWNYRGHLPEGIDRMAGALDRGRDAPPVLRAKAMAELSLLCSAAGDSARADALSAASVPLAREAGDTPRLAQVLFMRAQVAGSGRQRWDEARALLEEVLTRVEGPDPWSAFPANADELRFTRLPATWYWSLAPSTLSSLGEALVHEGERARGVALIEEGLARQRAQGSHLEASMSLATLGRLDQHGGDAARAAGRYAESLCLLWDAGLAIHVHVPISGLAGLAADRGWSEAAARLVGMVEGIRIRNGAVALPDWQAILRRTEQTEQAALGAEGFAEAVAVGQRLSISEAVAEALAVAGDLTQPAEARADAAAIRQPDALTERELEVLRLMVIGRSNPEIADALFIGRGTVRTHVSNILGKLGAASRTEAAHVARQRGLV